MKVLKIISIIINSITSFLSIILSIFIAILAYVFLSSHVESDKLAGIILIIFIPVIIIISITGLIFVIKKKKGILFWIGFCLGMIQIILYSFSIYLIPGLIEAGVRP